MKKKMQEIKAENPSTLVNIMATECPPLQFAREYSINSIEAIERAKPKKGIIHWGIDPFYLKKHKVEKLCITDNGDGMLLAEAVHHIGTLGVEGANKTHGERDNYGVGGKISGFRDNPMGIVYRSKKSGKCCLVVVGLIDGKYCIKEAKTITNKEMPTELQKERSGTMVTFLGKSTEENTARRFGDKAKKEKAGFKYLIQYLNTKFYDIPSRIKLTVLDSNDKYGGTKNRTIQGMKVLLDKNPNAKGVVKLAGFNAYWWIQKDDFSLNNGTIMGNVGGSNGHISIMMNNEVYERPSPPYTYLPRFGIYAGMRQVFIYLEPTGKDIFASITRTRLTINREQIPINEIGSQFNENMPKELRDFIDGMIGVNQSSDVKETLKRFWSKFKFPKFIQHEKGNVAGDLITGHTLKEGIGNTSGGNEGDNTYVPSTDRPVNNPKPRSGSGAKDKEIFGSSKKGTNSKEDGRMTDYPDVIWQSVKPSSENIGVRDIGDMEDRIGKYIPNTNTLIINADFKSIDEIIKYWKHRLGVTSESDEKIIRRAVYRGYELTLVDAIIHTKILGRSNADGWTEEVANRILSDEFSLTSIASPQFHLTSTLKHEIRKDIGRLN